MASPGGRARPPLEELPRKPYSFDFFQAVRLLERAALAASPPQSRADDARAKGAVGQDNPPDREPVRFRVLPFRLDLLYEPIFAKHGPVTNQTLA